MPRAKRIIKANLVYHVMNRANGRLRIFKKDSDYKAFETVVASAIERFKVRLTGYCIMGNHWHFLLWPSHAEQLSEIMKWLTVTHTQRWHAAHNTYGCGHVYQGRFKSFPVGSDEHYLRVMRYIESNPLRAGLVKCSQDWQWSSLSLRNGRSSDISLSDGPVDLPGDWNLLVNMGMDETENKAICNAVKRGCPYGGNEWTKKTASVLSLESSLKPLGRPFQK
ncbi:MAG: transposase [Phycisphaerae bacterium]|nr:transposase [Phycisphaerae bacterium]